MKVLVGIPADMQNGGGSRGIRRRFALLQAALFRPSCFGPAGPAQKN